MIRSAATAAALTAVLAASACAPYRPPFAHPGVTDAAYEHDRADCEAAAVARMHAAGWNGWGLVLGPLAALAQSDDDPRSPEAARAFVRQCLRDKGYRQISRSRGDDGG